MNNWNFEISCKFFKLILVVKIKETVLKKNMGYSDAKVTCFVVFMPNFIIGLKKIRFW